MTKRVMALACAFLLLFGKSAFAKPDESLQFAALGIFEPVEQGAFLQGEAVTRADMAVIISRLTGMDTASFGRAEQVFSDVPQTHWADAYIDAVAAIGIVAGQGNGVYRPDDAVKYEEAVKMLINLLSYTMMAENYGGYPEGHMAVAGKVGLLRGISCEAGGTLTQKDIVALIVNALNIQPMETGYNGTYQSSKQTLYEILIDRLSLIEIEGIVTENAITSIQQADASAQKGKIRIDGQEYWADADCADLLGYAVNGYAREEENGVYTIILLEAAEQKNELFICAAEDTKISLHDAEIYLDGRSTRLEFDDSVMFLYNGKAGYLGKQIYSGEYRFLDNDRDGRIEVVFIQEPESFVVSRINQKNQTVYFADNRLYRGQTSVTLDVENKDLDLYIQDTDGQALAFDEIAIGDGITLFGSADGSFLKAVVTKEKVSGTVSQISDDHTVVIDEKVYPLAIDSAGRPTVELKPGDSGSFVLDMYGRLIGLEGDKEGVYQFGYVTAAEQGNFPQPLQLQILIAGKPRVETIVKSGTETYKGHFLNDGMAVYSCAPQVRLNGTRVDAEAIQASELNGKLAAFLTNNQGQITQLSTYAIPGQLENHTFNAKIVSFGGSSRGYMTDRATQILCIPNSVQSKDDYFVQLSLADKSGGHKVFGICMEAEVTDGMSQAELEYQQALPMDVVVIMADMDSTKPTQILSDAEICVVGKVTTTLGTQKDDVDSTVYKIELLNRGEVVTEYTASSGKAFELAGKLQKGDLIRYSKDGYGRVSNLERLDSLQGLTRYGETVNGGFYGLAQEVQLYMYDYRDNAMIDRVLLQYNDYLDMDIIRILREDGPPVYLYDRQSGWITSATAEDIVAGSSDVYVYKEHGQVATVVIMRD